MSSMTETIPWENTWNKIVKTIERNVAELNSSKGGGLTCFIRKAKDLSDKIPVGVQIVSQRGPFERAVIEIDPNTGTMQFEKGPRRDTFTIRSDGFVVLQEHSAGEPIPSKEPMTAELFAKFFLAKQHVKR